MAYLDTYYNSISQEDRDRAIDTNDISNDLQRHSHAASRVHPKFAAPITIISGAGSYVEGDAAEIVPNSIIITEWDIHDIFVSATDIKDKDYIITIYNNNNHDNIAEAVVRLSTNVSAVNISYAKSGPIPANVGVYAKVAVEGGGSNGISIRIQYDLTGAA